MTKSGRQSSPSPKKRVFIIDDQPIIRERVIELINGQPDLTICGEADEIRTAMELISREQPDLVITGLSFKHSHGLGLVKDFRARFPEMHVLVFSIYDELLYGERAIRAGARGFIEKRAPTNELLRAVRQVLSGEIYLSHKASATTVGRFFRGPSPKPGSPLEQLSDRELEVFQLIGRGQSTKQIAAALRVDVKTIETYRGRIKVKLKLLNAAELRTQAKHYLEEMYSARV
ncbi:MAG: response regulator [Chthoniobacterales bacterium]